jgi:hypothetical protein
MATDLFYHENGGLSNLRELSNPHPTLCSLLSKSSTALSQRERDWVVRVREIKINNQNYE